MATKPTPKKQAVSLAELKTMVRAVVKEHVRKSLAVKEQVEAPRVAGGDEVRELVLTITNDYELYRQQVQPILANLRKKIKKGTYQPELALKLWMYLADSGAKKYAKVHGSPGFPWHKMFPTSVRRQVAKELQDSYEEELTFQEAAVTTPPMNNTKTEQRNRFDDLDDDDDFLDSDMGDETFMDDDVADVSLDDDFSEEKYMDDDYEGMVEFEDDDFLGADDDFEVSSFSKRAGRDVGGSSQFGGDRWVDPDAKPRRKGPLY